MGVPESATVIATNAAGDMVQSTFNVTIQPPVLNRLGDVFTIDGTVSGVSPALASESYDAIVGNTTNDLAGIMVQTLSTNTSGVAPTGAALSALDSEISSGNSNLYFELNFGPVGSGVDKFLNLQYGNVTAGGADITAGTPTAGAVYAAQILGEVEKSFSTTNLTTASELTGATASNLLVQDYNNTVNFPSFTYDDVFLIRADRLTAAGITLLEANTGVIEHVFNVVDPAASSSVPSLSFGNEAVGVPETLHVTITNNGTANLDITGFSAPAGYTVVPDGSSGFGSGVNIAVGGHQLFDVTFTPGATGTDNGNLVFTDNDPILADSTIALTGESDVVTLVGAGIPTQNATLGQPVDIKTAQYFSEPVAGDNLTYSFQGQHSGLQINPSTGEITGTGNFLTSESITVNATNQFGSQVQSTFELNVQGVDMRLGDAFSADGTVSGVVPAIAPETYDAAVGNTTNSLGGIIVQTVYSNTTGATPAASDVAILDSELTSGSSNIYFELGYGAVKAGATDGFGSGLSIEYGTDTYINSGAAESVYVAILQASDVVQSGSPSISYLAEQISGTEGISIGVGNLNNSPTQSAEQVTLIRADQLINTAPDNLISTLEAQPNLIEKVFFVQPEPKTSFSVPNLSFGDVAAGHPETMQVTITNNGNAVMDVTGYNAPAGYSVLPDGSSTFGNVTIAVGAQQIFDVTFDPTVSGIDNGPLVFTTNDPVAADNAMTVTGESDFVTTVGAGIPAQTVTEGQSLVIMASQYFNEPLVGDNLTYSLQGPSWMHINPTTGEVISYPSIGSSGSARFCNGDSNKSAW